MTRAAIALPIPTPVPEFLAPRVESVRQKLRTGQREQGLALARAISSELTDSYGPLHHYTLHAHELLAFCAQLAGDATTATDVSVQTAVGWQRLLPAQHPQIRRQARNGAASWLTVTTAPDAVRSGTALLALLQSVYGADHPSTLLVEKRLTAIASADEKAVEQALQPSGPALLLQP